MDKKWKPIKGYEGLYEVSNTGEVRRKRQTNSGNIDSLLVLSVDKYGYRRARLCKDGKVNAQFVHRLVASAFIGEFDGEVNHINGNKGDNRLPNLEWCSHKENLMKAAETGLIKCKSVRQTKNGEEITVFPSLCEASRITGFDKSNLARCCHGKTKTAYGFEWAWAKRECVDHD